jgi:hypothetical protein
VIAAGSGVDGLSRDAAADAARRELARRPYRDAQPPLLARLLGRLLSELGRLIDRASAHAPGGGLGLLLLLVLLVLVVAVVLTRLRPRRGERSAGLFDPAASLSADDHRSLADAAAREGRFDDAVRERLRAVVRELEARGVLDPRPGRTADEVAREAGAAVPEVAEDLRRAVGVFAEVWYGGRPASASAYGVLVDVDRRLLDRRLVVR